MGSIVDYGTLSTAVQSFSLDRTDLAAPMSDLVTMAEHAIYHGLEGMEPLRAREMQAIDTVVSTAGIGPLPATYLQWQRVVETSSPRRELEYIAPAAADQMYATRAGGPGNHFSVIGSNIYTYPLVTGNLELTHYALPTALVSGTPTSSNAMLLKYPSLYLRATMAMGYEYLKNNEEMQKQLALLKSMVAMVNKGTQMSSLAKTGISFRRQVR